MSHYLHTIGHASPWLIAAAGIATLAPTALTAYLLRRVLRGKKAADTLTVVAAAMASSVAATGMWHFFTRTMHLPASIQAVLFAFMEVAVLASALRARANVAREGNAGADGLAVWVLTFASGFMSATEATSPQEALVRLGAPLVAAWLWERSMVPQRRARRVAAGQDADGVLAKIRRTVRERFLAALGITAPDLSALEIRQNRALANAVRLADRLAEFDVRLFAETRRQRLTRRLRSAVRLSGAAIDPARAALLKRELGAVRNAAALATLDLPTPWDTPFNDTATPQCGDTPADTSHATGPADTDTAVATETTPDTPVAYDTAPGNDTAPTDTVPQAATPEPPVAPRPRPARVVSNLPVQDLEADVARLTSVAISLGGGAGITAWPDMSKADAIRNADRLLPDRPASQVVKALAQLGVKVDDVLVRKTRSRDRQNAATATGGDDTTDQERVA